MIRYRREIRYRRTGVLGPSGDFSLENLMGDRRAMPPVEPWWWSGCRELPNGTEYTGVWGRKPLFGSKTRVISRGSE